MNDLHNVIADLLAAEGDDTRRVRLRVTSGSMRPMIQVGDVLVCIPLPPARQSALNALRIGDILVVRRAEDFLAHRLIRRRGEAWYTKGDRSRSLDAPVSSDQILACVVGIERSAPGARSIDLTRWDQQILQRCKGLWGAVAAGIFQVARILFRR